MCTMEKIEIIETTKGKPLDIFNGYQFRKYSQNENEIIWVCLNEKKNKCIGRMRTKKKNCENNYVNNIRLLSHAIHLNIYLITNFGFWICFTYPQGS